MLVCLGQWWHQVSSPFFPLLGGCCCAPPQPPPVCVPFYFPKPKSEEGYSVVPSASPLLPPSPFLLYVGCRMKRGLFPTLRMGGGGGGTQKPPLPLSAAIVGDLLLLLLPPPPTTHTQPLCCAPSFPPPLPPPPLTAGMGALSFFLAHPQ